VADDELAGALETELLDEPPQPDKSTTVAAIPVIHALGLCRERLMMRL
jgi:hypothetical protein